MCLVWFEPGSISYQLFWGHRKYNWCDIYEIEEEYVGGEILKDLNAKKNLYSSKGLIQKRNWIDRAKEKFSFYTIPFKTFFFYRWFSALTT